MMVVTAKLIIAGLTTIGLVRCGVGEGFVFGSLMTQRVRHPSLLTVLPKHTFFEYVLTEVLGLRIALLRPLSSYLLCNFFQQLLITRMGLFMTIQC